MMDKKSITLVFFIAFSLLLIQSAFAGCCINTAAGSAYTCKEMDQGDCPSGGNFYSISCNLVPGGLCDKACIVCQTGNVQPIKEFVDLKILGCSIGQYVTTIPNIANQTACSNAIIPVVSNLPNVTGTVTFNNNPVSNVDVYCEANGVLAKTNQAGQYRLVGCAIGSQAITATNGTHMNSTVRNLLSNQEITVNFALQSSISTSVTVIVKNQTGIPISGLVKLTDIDERVQQNTGSTVIFTDVHIGNVRIDVTAEGYDYSSKTYALASQINVVLNQTTKVPVRGSVYDNSTGTPALRIPGVIIEVVDPANSNVVFATNTTNENGVYELRAPVGSYILRATKTGYTTNSRSITFVTGTNYLTTDFYLKSAAPTAPSETNQVQITVKNEETGAFVSGAYVWVNGVGIFSDANGKATFQLDRNNDFAIRVDHNEYLSHSGTIIKGTSSYQVNLTPKVEITITGNVFNGTTTSRSLRGATITSLDSSATSAVGTGAFTLKVKVNMNVLKNLTVYASYPGFFTGSKTITLTSNQIDYSVGNIFLSSSECSSSSNIVINVSAVQDKGNISLVWTSPCTPVNFVINKKIASNPYREVSIINPPTRQFRDGMIEGNTRYCYTVKGNFYFQSSPNPQLQKTSNEVCVDVGPAECFKGDITYCNSNVKVICNNGNATLVPCLASELCIEESPVAQCVPTKQCGLCNRPFDLFSTEFSGGSLFGGKGFEDSLFSFSYETSLSPFICRESSIPCYLDYSKTSVDKYYSCQNKNSCYDYVSKDACVGNLLKGIEAHKCTAENCEWVDSSYKELGLGVCRPTIKANQDCGMFESKSDIFNKIFTNGTVAKDFCLLYGELCYYSNSKGTCLNADEVSCNDYSTLADCVGSVDPKNVSIDVLWTAPSIGNKRYTKSSGTNAMIQESKDLFDRRVCKFLDNGGCARDADDNAEKYDTEEGRYFSGGTNDCASIDTKCNLDFRPPTTIMNIPDNSYVKSVDFNYTASDNESSSTKTYFTVAPAGSAIYPVTETATTNSKIYKTITGNPQAEPYVVSYFSEDSAKNLEVVKNINIIVDKVAPVIDFSKKVIPDLQNLKVTFIPTLTIDPSTGDTLAHCIQTPNTGLFQTSPGVRTRLSQHPVDSPMGDFARSSWTETYNGIYTGTNGILAEYVWECYDLAGNKAVVTKKSEIRLDADMIIDDPQPDSAVRERLVPISLTTPLFSGKCRYSALPITNTNQWNSATLFDTSDDALHTSQVTVPANEQYKTFYTACNLTGIPNLVIGKDPMDTIKITIDDIPPVTKIYKSNSILSDAEMNQLIWVNSNSLDLVCEDVNQSVQGYPSESGCKKVWYCVGNSCNLDSDGEAMATPNITESTSIKFSSEDVLGNLQPERTINVKFDNEPPELNLSSPLNESFMETNKRELTIKGFVTGVGSTNDVIAPLKDVKWYLSGLPSKSGNITFGTPNSRNEVSIEQKIPLNLNQKNNLIVEVTDFAGNSKSYQYTIIQDSAGPSITTEQISGTILSSDPRYGGSTFPDVDQGKDLELTISNVKDNYSESNDPIYLRTRVPDDGVWVEDEFGSEYPLTRGIAGSWVGTLSLASWPISSTALVIHTKDILGNEEIKRVPIQIKDVTPPYATLMIQNLYGDVLDTLSKGKNNIILTASEKLRNVTLSLSNSTRTFNVTFTAMTSDRINWIGYVDVPAGLTGELTINGIMFDSNGVNSSEFGASSIPVNSIDYNSGIRPINGKLIGDIYYTTGVADGNQIKVAFDNLRGDYSYQFTVNDKILTPSDNFVSGFKIGLNNILIRAESSLHNYEIINQKVFVDMTPPAITSYPAGTYKTYNDVKVVFTEDGSGIDNASTTMVIGSITKKLSNSAARTFTLNATDVTTAGTRTGTVTIRDNAGNSITQEFTFRINSSAPTVSINSNDLTLFNGKYLTSKTNPVITVNPSTLTASVDGTVTPLSSITLTSEGSHTLHLTDASGNFWDYTIVLDQTAPQFNIYTNSITNGQPVDIKVHVNNEEFPVTATASVDGQSNPLTYVNKELYVFNSNVNLNEGNKNINVTLRDKVSNENKIGTSILVDKTIQSINMSNITYENLRIFNRSLVSNSQIISVVGADVKNTDVTKVYVIGEDKNKYDASSTAPTSFIVSSVRLIGQILAETTNNLKLVFEDEAGNKAQESISVLKDLLPPYLIRLEITK